MYAIHSCPPGQPDAGNPVPPARTGGLILHLQDNRSHLSAEARAAFTVLIGLFLVVAILPALRGQWLVPLFAIGAVALLVAVLDWHRRSQPAAEWLAIDGGRLLWRSITHPTIEWPLRGTGLVCDETVPARLRLFLSHHGRRIEIGACLALEEKRALAPLIAREIAAACPLSSEEDPA